MIREKSVSIILWGLALLVWGCVLQGCSTSPDHEVWKLEEKQPVELMEEGMELYNENAYALAIEAFQKIVDRYPYSKYSIDAELKLADCHYYEYDYEIAYDAYSEFQRLHPKNANMPYVLYQMGMCHFDQTSTIDRDQSHTQMAAQQFERLVNTFPKSEYSSKAYWKIRECYILLAESELYVGRFYFKMEKYGAAMKRFRYLLENYPDLGQYHDALEYLSLCQEKMRAEE